MTEYGGGRTVTGMCGGRGKPAGIVERFLAVGGWGAIFGAAGGLTGVSVRRGRWSEIEGNTGKVAGMRGAGEPTLNKTKAF